MTKTANQFIIISITSSAELNSHAPYYYDTLNNNLAPGFQFVGTDTPLLVMANLYSRKPTIPHLFW